LHYIFPKLVGKNKRKKSQLQFFLSLNNIISQLKKRKKKKDSPIQLRWLEDQVQTEQTVSNIYRKSRIISLLPSPDDDDPKRFKMHPLASYLWITVRGKQTLGEFLNNKDRYVKTRNVCRPGNEKKYSAKGGVRSLNHSPHRKRG
jgi:hypothetical protein